METEGLDVTSEPPPMDRHADLFQEKIFNNSVTRTLLMKRVAQDACTVSNGLETFLRKSWFVQHDNPT
ncbi:hypothetical protein J6590_106141, partial [Homalodisca vitripennis]